MKCPNCQRENEPTSHFCIYCGSILQSSETGPSPEPEQSSDEVPLEYLQSLRRDIQRLEGLISLMNERLLAMEKLSNLPSAEARPAEPVTPPPAEPVPVSAAAGAGEAPVVERWESPIEQPPLPPGTEAKKSTFKEREWEQILGGHWLARIGVIAIVIGIGFFLKYAFDNNWIGPTGRIILGIVAGLAMLGGGYYWQKKYPILAQAISGGGIAVLYLSIFAAFAVYDLIHFYVAFGFLFLVSITSAGLALRYNSMALAIIGILGAFLAPFILSVSAPSVPGTGSTDTGFWLLIGYVMVVDIGVLVLSTFRNWRWFTLLALISSLSVYGLLHMNSVGILASMLSLTIIFLIFVGATTLFNIVWRRPAQPFDEAVIVINAAAYFGISFGLMWSDFRIWLGGFAVLLALFYGVIAYIVLRRGTENVRLGFFALSIALVFLTIAIPVQIGDRAWTTIAWAAEGIVLLWLSFTLRMHQLRGYGYAVLIITMLRLLFFDHIVDMRTYQPILNERFLAFAVSIAAFYFGGYLLRRNRETLREWEQQMLSIYPVLFVAANFFTIWLLSAEVIDYFDTSLALTILWAVYAVMLLVIGMVKQWRPVRLWALATLVIPIVKVFAYDVFTLDRVYRIIAFIVLGLLLVASGYLYNRYNKSIRGFIAKK